MSDAGISNPAYRIETSRMVIRCYEPADIQMQVKSITESIEHLKPWMAWANGEPEPMEEKEKRLRTYRAEFDLGQNFRYGVFDPQETRHLGAAGLMSRVGENQLEIGYWIHKDFVNQGLMTEATAALVKVAFEIMRIHRLEIHCDPENFASAAIPRKLGFTYEGTLRAKTRFLDRWSDSMIWGLLEDEYSGSPASRAELKVFDAFGRPLL
jgi:RimJ/RimL family protein N-acetyltransferase